MDAGLRAGLISSQPRAEEVRGGRDRSGRSSIGFPGTWVVAEPRYARSSWRFRLIASTRIVLKSDRRGSRGRPAIVSPRICARISAIYFRTPRDQRLALARSAALRPRSVPAARVAMRSHSARASPSRPRPVRARARWVSTAVSSGATARARRSVGTHHAATGSVVRIVKGCR